MQTSPVMHMALPVQGGSIAVDCWGDPAKPVVVLVHVYPDNRQRWHEVVRQLSADFRVVAYDVRGAGDSFRPHRREDYALSQLTADFQVVLDAVSPDRPVHLVGHDWGSVQGWEFVTEPGLKGRIASFTSCSGPCLDHMGFWVREQFRHPSPRGLLQIGVQTLKSWYVYFFHLPVLPEALWRHVLGRHWPALMRRLEGIQNVPDHPAMQAADGQHGVWLYRANFLPRLMHPRERFAHAPVQVLVPTGDHFVSPALSADLGRWVPQLTRRELAAGHWVPLEQPGLFAQAVREYVTSISPAPQAASFL